MIPTCDERTDGQMRDKVQTGIGPDTSCRVRDKYGLGVASDFPAFSGSVF